MSVSTVITPPRCRSAATSSGARTGLLRWIVPSRWNGILLVLAVMAAVTRLPSLQHPTDGGTPIFDEKHYAPQAWQILRGTSNPLVGGLEDNPGFGLVVHPPLAKQLQALGMAVFGYTPVGWRIITALLACVTIVLIAALARRISGSQWVGLIAGILALSDGILFVTGRSGMLDHTQTLFVVLAAYAGVRDHQQMQRRFQHVFLSGQIKDYAVGPRMGYRWWRVAMGVALGLAISVKWSGLYYMAFAGVFTVIVDYLRRKHFQVRAPLRGTLILDCFPAFFSTVIIPMLLYIFNFRAWFASDSSVYRHAVESGQAAGFGAGTPIEWLALPIQNFLYYHYSVLQFHTSLTNSAGHYHPWESKPWSWLVSARSLMYYNPAPDAQGLRHIVLLVGTPAIWWLSVPVLLWGLWRLIIRHDTAWSVPLVGFAAGFLPWLFTFDRQMYLFYAVNLAPFLVIALALAVGHLSTLRVGHQWLGRNIGRILAVGYISFCVWNFLFFIPMYTGMSLTENQWLMRIWLPSWA